MKLQSFSVRNYRSIIEAYKLSLGNYTVLVGPNNEGKSNILKAIALSLQTLTKERVRRLRRTNVRYRRSRTLSTGFDWDRDFPLSLQEKRSDGRAFFTLEFSLDSSEYTAFKKDIGVNLNSNLKVKLGFGVEDTTFEILMKGRGKKTLNNKKEDIAAFIKKHLASEYISALRPSEMAISIVNDLIEAELYTLEDDPQYIKLIDEVKAIQQPILDKISNKLCLTVSNFIPAVDNIKISNNRLAQAFRNSFNIIVDDGAETELALKGDGIISLTTMALMKHVSEDGLGAKNLMLSIEEPESHLHPEAIHGLRNVLKDISKTQQVIITTHSPILVEREHVSQNIVVHNGRALKAKKLGDIRSALGIQMSDNLISAFVVLLVEGTEDRDLLNELLPKQSPVIKSALDKRLLVIDHLAGASNLSYKTTFYRQNVCNVHVFMDNDEDGRKAVNQALDKAFLQIADYTLTACSGMKNCEVEDLLDPKIYTARVLKDFGINLDCKSFKKTSKKWADRAETEFISQAKIWNKSVKMKLKRTVIDEAISNSSKCIPQHRQQAIDALVKALEQKLNDA